MKPTKEEIKNLCDKKQKQLTDKEVVKK